MSTTAPGHFVNRSRQALVVAAVCLAGFAAVAWQVVAEGALTRWDAAIAEQMYRFTRTDPDLYDGTLWLTDLNSGLPRTILVVSVLAVLMLDRRWGLVLVWLGSQWLSRELVSWSKEQFARDRPGFPDTPMLAGGWAFPSGHAVGAVVTFEMLAYFLLRQMERGWIRGALIGILAVLAFAIGLSRIMLGVHWFTDVLGGFLLGTAYIALWIALVEWRRPRVAT